MRMKRFFQVSSESEAGLTALHSNSEQVKRRGQMKQKDWPTFLYQFSLVQPAPQGHRIRRIPTGSSALSPWKNPSAFCAWQGPAKKIWCFGLWWHFGTVLHFTSLSMALRLDGHCHQCRQRHSCQLYTFQKPHQNLHWSAPLMLSGLHSHSRSCPTKWQYKSFGELYHKRRTNAKAVFRQRGCS